MSITLYTKQVKDKIEDGRLILYFPKSFDFKKDKLKHYKLIEWLKYWGLKVEYKKDMTLIVYPKNFQLKDIFYKRESFKYVQSYNKISGKNVSDNDFLSLCFSKFYVCSGIAEGNVSSVLGLDENDGQSGTKMMYFNYVNKKYFNNNSDIVYVDSLSSLKDIKENIFKNCLIKPEEKILFLRHKDEIEENLKENKLYKSELIDIGSLECDGLKDRNFKSIERFIVSVFGDYKIAYNAFSSLVFSFGLNENDRKIDFTNKESILNSTGVYLTKTLVKLKDLGVLYDKREEFSSEMLQFYNLKSIYYRHPKFLLDALVEHCKNIDKIYDNSDYNVVEDENVKIFLSGMLEDLELGMRSLGMFIVNEYREK